MARYRVPSVERAFRLLELLARHAEGESLGELVGESGFAKTTVFMILETLKDLGAIYDDGGRFHLGISLIQLGGIAAERLDLKAAAQPEMQWLHDRTGFTVHLGVWRDGNVVFIDKLEGGGFIRFSSHVGWTEPFYLTSLGKAMAAYLPQEAYQDKVPPFQARTIHTIVSLDDLVRALNEVRQKGYAVENEEQEEGVRCIGAAILGAEDTVLGALSVTAVSSQLRVEEFSTVGDLVAQAAARVSSTLVAANALGGI